MSGKDQTHNVFRLSGKSKPGYAPEAISGPEKHRAYIEKNRAFAAAVFLNPAPAPKKSAPADRALDDDGSDAP